MQRDDLSMLTAEELRLRQRKRRRLLFGGVAALLLILAALFAARPARHAIKAWQARRHALKASAFVESGDWSGAQKEATAAYQLAPNEPAAIRAVAHFLSQLRQPQALDFWDRLAKLRPLTRDDLRDEAGVALALGEIDRAATAISPLLASEGRDATPRDWLLAAQLAAERGAPNESFAALERIFTNPTTRPAEHLQAALLKLRFAASANDQDKQSDAWTRIEKLSVGHDAVGLDALVLLAQRELARKAETGNSDTLKLEDKRQRTEGGPNADTGSSPLTNNKEPITAAALASALEEHPLAKAPQQLLSTDLRIHGSPNEKEKLIQAAIERWKNASNDDLGVLAKWLNGHGEFERELATVPLEHALQTRELFLQHVDALGALARWEEIRRLLESERFPLDPTVAHMYLARCYAQLGQKTASENNWQRALEGAGDAPKLMTLADYAEKNGASAIAASAYDRVTAAAPKLRPAWQGKLRLKQVSRETAMIHAVLAEMLKIWPNDPAIQNDEAYTRLLQLPNDGSRDQELREIDQIGEKLMRDEPSSLPHRTLLALTRLKLLRPTAALEVYKGINVSPRVLTPSALAVHAAVLNANGKTDDARTEIEQAPLESLLPEEQQGTANLRAKVEK